jgi:hypothetical protein
LSALRVLLAPDFVVDARTPIQQLAVASDEFAVFLLGNDSIKYLIGQHHASSG